MTNDLRKYIQIVESQGQLDEAGGFIDKMLSKLGGIPGFSDVASGAEGKVGHKEVSRILRKAWVKHAAGIKKNKKDPEAIKDFFREFGLDEFEISSIEGLDGPKADLKTVFASGSAIAIKKTGSDVARTSVMKKSAKRAVKGAVKGAPKKIKDRPTGADFESNAAYFKQKLGGNGVNAQKEALKIRKNPKAYKDRPLALLGWAYLEANGLKR